MEHVTRQEDDSASLLYHVKRPVYNVGYIEGNLLHRRKRTTKTFSQRLAAQLRCSSARARSIVFSFVPILTWLPSYPVKEYLFGDVVSGLSTGVMQLPQGLAYAMLAALPPVYGLYTSFYPVLLYTFFGTSRHVSIGTFAVVSLMIGGVVIREAPDSMFYTQALNGTNASAVLDTEARDSRRVQLAVALSCQVGIIQLILGLLQFGFVAIYLTEPLVRGFTTAASVHVCVSQLKYFLGIKTMRFSGPLSVLHSLVAVLTNISSTNVNTLIIGTVCILFLFTVKKINDRFKGKLPVPIPGEIIVVIVSTGISYGIQLSDNYKVAVVGKIPTGLLPPAVPDFSVFSCLITDSITIAVVSFAVGISLAKTFALKHGYSVDGNQELIALGVCNFLSSFFHTFTVTSSMSRSLVQESTGGKTQIAGLLASLVVLLVVVAIGFFFQPLPQTVLASIIIVNLQGMFLQFGDICALWKMSGIELGIWLVSFIASVLLGLDYGLMVAIGFAVLTVIYRTQSPKRMILGEIPDTGIYCDIEDYEEATECTGIKIFHSNAPIYFANSDLYINSLKEKTGVNPALLLATQKSHRTKKKRGKEEKAARYKAESQKREAVVKLDVETGVTHEVVGGVEFHLVPLKNGQAAEGLVEYDSEETQFDSESETHNFLGHRPPSAVHSIILDFTPVNFIDSVGVKAIKSVIKEYAEVDIQIFLAGCSSTLLADLRSLQFFVGAVTPELAFPSIHDAVLHCLHRSRTGRDAAVSVA